MMLEVEIPKLYGIKSLKVVLTGVNIEYSPEIEYDIAVL
jgi:hypothetical protein